MQYFNKISNTSLLVLAKIQLLIYSVLLFYKFYCLTTFIFRFKRNTRRRSRREKSSIFCHKLYKLAILCFKLYIRRTFINETRQKDEARQGLTRQERGLGKRRGKAKKARRGMRRGILASNLASPRFFTFRGCLAHP